MACPGGNMPDKTVIITGKVTLTFKQILVLPDDEAEDLVLSCEDDISCNVDLNQCSWDIDEYEDVEAWIEGED